jgi:2-keto-4-pentenoate hydratase/2-oxohepta-3-ene-1,7-dioic acid hydratase in catechol pathway
VKLRRGPAGLMAERDDGSWAWLPEVREASTASALSEEQTTDLIAFLAGGGRVRAAAAEALAATAANPQVTVDPTTAGLPFQPRSMRAFMLWESHMIASSRMLVKRFFPPPAAKAVAGFERVTGRTFPKLKPNRRFREKPTFYVANHGALVADGDSMWWPAHTKWLDFELELAFVLAKPLADADEEEAAEAVGGWFIVNDWSARDVQAEDARKSIFGPVVKSKTFANSIGSDVVTVDEVPDWTRLSGRVRVDGEVWCEGSTAGPAHDIGAMLAYASAGERLEPGDVVSTGTMPGCCGLEIDRWVQPGQTVELEIDGIGTLTNRVDSAAQPHNATVADS